MVKNADCTHVCNVDCDNRAWLDGETCRVTVHPDLSGVPAGAYDLYIGLFAGDRPVYFALKDTIRDGGFYCLRRGVSVRAL